MDVDPGRLNDLEFLRQMSLEGVRRSGATIVGEHFKQFEPQGISGVIIIAESHLSFHSWPEFSYIAMDYFTCGEHIDIDAAISYFNDCLSPDKVVKSRHDRGTDLAGMEWAIPQHVKGQYEESMGDGILLRRGRYGQHGAWLPIRRWKRNSLGPGATTRIS